MLGAVRAGQDVAMAVDGPRGPRHCAKPGAARIAARARARLVPVGAAASPAVLLRGAWDHFMVPLPFARIVIQVGAAVDARGAVERASLLDQAISSASASARARLCHGAVRPMRVNT